MGAPMARIDSDKIREAVDIAQIVGQYVQWTEQGREFKALCPFHKERSASFTVTPQKGMYYCFGCQAGGDVFKFVQGVEGLAFADAVRRVAELGGVSYLLDSPDIRPNVPKPATIHQEPQQSLPKRTAAARTDHKPKPDLGKPVAIYKYTDEQGQLTYEVHRHEYINPETGEREKEFKQRRPRSDGSWVWGIKAGLYRKGSSGDWYPARGEQRPGDIELPETRRVLYRLTQLPYAETICIVEGEKDVHTLESLGFVATTHAGGANGRWPEEAANWLAGKTVVLLPDRDEPGKKHGQRVVKALKDIPVLWLDVPLGKDITDFVEAGGDARGLIENRLEQWKRERIEAKGLLTPLEIMDLLGGFSAFGDASQRPKGLATGLSKLDEMTLGMFPGQMIILAARTSVGKTALAVNIGVNVAKKGKRVYIFSLEMGRDELLTRMICSEAFVDSLKFRAGYLSDRERYKFQAASHQLSEYQICIDDTAHMTVPKIAERIEQHGRPDLVIVDYLQLVAGAGKKENRTQEVSQVSRGLKLLAKELRIPFLVLAQLNRSPETRPTGDGVPQLSDLRESGSIEQDADAVWFIYRPEMTKPDREDLRGLAYVYVAKQRNGPRGKVKLAFLGFCTRFDNLAEGASDDR